MAYQDTWIHGRAVATGERSCADRYALVREIVGAYTRPATVWDLGANLGYFGCRLAEEFGCVSVMVEARPHLVDVCRQNAIPTTIALTKRITSDELSDLAASEHADVVLALSFLHRVADWRGTLDAVLALGETIVIETPARHETTAVNFPIVGVLLDAIEAEGGELIGTTAIPQSPTIRRPVYLLRRSKPAVIRACCQLSRLRIKGATAPPRPHVITSTLSEKTVEFMGSAPRPWFAGMNLWNWAVMGGSYPHKPVVRKAVQRAAARLTEPHGDFRPWNLILQGSKVRVIDAGHRRSVPDARGAADTLRWIETPSLAYVQ